MAINWGRAVVGGGLAYVSWRIIRSAFSDANAAVDRLQAARCPGNGSIPCKLVPAGSIDNRGKMLAGMIRKGSLDPRVRRLALRSVAKKCGDQFCTASRDAVGELKAILGDFTDPGSELYQGMKELDGVLAEFKSRVRYTSDARSVDQFQSAPRTLFDFHAGDCDDAAVALGSLYSTIGYPVKVRVIRTKDAEDYNHVYILVNPDKRGEKWIPVDGSVDFVKLNGKKKPIYVGWEAPDRMVAERRDYDV